MDLVNGKLICLVRARSDEEAQARLDATFDSGDPYLVRHYRELGASRRRVLAGDKEGREPTWAWTGSPGSSRHGGPDRGPAWSPCL